ncbi:YusW family protein [Solibacillus sp. FSL K6-4121]|uniref:YusW family protein n=1 Tax=Solibacillus sp. FSL K6-4121 TaxID=2921505 RepID=UPI0030F61039
MKLFKLLLTMPLLLGLLYACNNDDTKTNKDVTGNNSTVDETANNKNTTNNSENENERTGIKVADVNYAFTEFDLDVEYANRNSYDVEYENDGNNIYAEIDDEIKGIEYKGDQAYENFVDALKQLTFDETTSDDDVRKEVLKAFALDENYKSFELEVKFKNGEIKHYHHNK